jgi:hypothetical protein
MVPLVTLQLVISGCINPAKVNQDSEQKTKVVAEENSCTRKIASAVKMIQVTEDGKFCFYGDKNRLLGDGTIMALPLNTVLDNMVSKVKDKVSQAEKDIQKAKTDRQFVKDAFKLDINEGKNFRMQALTVFTLGTVPALIRVFKTLDIEDGEGHIKYYTKRIEMLQLMNAYFSQPARNDLFTLPSTYNAYNFEIDLTKSVEEENRKLSTAEDKVKLKACPEDIATAFGFEDALKVQADLLAQ